MDKNIKILIVDDEPDIRDFLGYNLRKEGYQTFEAGDGEESLEIALREIPNLIILDIMMPGMDGIEACRRIRQESTLDQCMVLFLTARDEDFTQIAGFDVGADDYINKPIKPRVFVSRVKALLRRLNTSKDTGKRVIGDLEIDKETFELKVLGEAVRLPKKEFELLYLLSSKPGKVFHYGEVCPWL